MDTINPGNRVVTIGGLHGVIEKVNSEDQTVELNCEDVILVIPRKRAIHRCYSTAAPTNPQVRTEEVALKKRVVYKKGKFKKIDMEKHGSIIR